ncbi:unnamed protein product [Brachionus calyciflorus]|uniref:Uncharacterized protein n=1 Tax=Brachionus calyciflorus TaxID=104777 RepID=A0A814A948_9BILA|nr:unnamed protein product [Brachionus calyciflorus]
MCRGQMKIILILLIFMFKKSQSIDGQFTAKFSDIDPKNFSQISDCWFPNLSLMSCLIKCLSHEFCTYVRYADKTCSLHTIFAKQNFVSSNKKIIYRRNFIKENCLSSPCKNQGVCINRPEGFDCLCQNGFFGKNCASSVQNYHCTNTMEFWSLKLNKCIPCPTNFQSIVEYPFNCYHKSGKILTYSSAKLFCEQMNSNLLRTKCITERNYFQKIYNRNITWLDSKITYLGEEYLWSDGSKVYGFYKDEPNNSGKTYLYESVLVLYDGQMVDTTENNTALVVCQYTDSNEYLYS